MKIRKNIRSQHLMKKIILILITVLFTSNVYAHLTKGVTPNFDYNQNCTKKRSVLNYISKHRLYKGDNGEIIKFNSYTAFDVKCNQWSL
jgi:hypothetical protein